MRRSWILGLLALLMAGPGCATSTRRNDLNTMASSPAWANSPAPPQTQETLPPERDLSASNDRSQTTGLAKYFPSLARGPIEEPKVASTRYRPSWFGLRKPKADAPSLPTSYVSLNRSGFSLNGAAPSSLPVALQVPATDGDRAVTPTSVEISVKPSDTSPSSNLNNVNRPGLLDGPLERASTTARQTYNDDVNPLPPAEEPKAPSPAATADKPAGTMPVVPEVSPVDPSQAAPAADASKPTNMVDDAAPPDRGPAVPTVGTAPKPPTPEVELPKVETPATPKDDAPAPSPTPAGPKVETGSSVNPTSFFHHKTMAVRGSSQSPVLPSPQTVVKPTPQVVVKPTPQVVVKATPQAPIKASPQIVVKPVPQVVVKPTAQTVVKPSPQGSVKPSPQTAETCDNMYCVVHHWKRPCLRREVRRLCGIGEFACPPTAAPH